MTKDPAFWGWCRSCSNRSYGTDICDDCARREEENEPIEDCVKCGEGIQKGDSYIHVVSTFMTEDADIEKNNWDSEGIYCKGCWDKMAG